MGIEGSVNGEGVGEANGAVGVDSSTGVTGDAVGVNSNMGVAGAPHAERISNRTVKASRFFFIFSSPIL